MGITIEEILTKDNLSKRDIISLLESKGEDRTLLFKKSAEIKKEYVSNKVWFRGLIEFSNICGKDCLYCGIRKGNKNLKRYNLSDDEILAAAKFAYDNKYGSIALQSGELENDFFTERVEATTQALYSKIHPTDSKHNFNRRLECLQSLQDIGYQTGTKI